jgi:hypothetical protein
MADGPIDVLKRWEDGGAVWRVIALGDEHVSIDLCACTGEPVDRLDSGDPDLIAFVNARAAEQSPRFPE